MANTNRVTGRHLAEKEKKNGPKKSEIKKQPRLFEGFSSSFFSGNTLSSFVSLASAAGIFWRAAG